MKTTKSRKPDFSLVLPCYNEGPHMDENVKKIVETLKMSKLSYEIILIDDKSKDRTRELVKRIAKTRKNFSFFFHRVNQGRGKTVSDGIKKAKGRVVGFIDIDLEISPVYIPHFVGKILDGRADIVTGHRAYRETLISLPRAVSSRGYSFLVRRILGVQLNDTETGYKFFDRRKILPVLKKTRSPGWFWDTEIMTIAYYQGLKIEEIPVLFTRRFDKQSTVNIIPDTLDYFVNLCRFRKRVKKGFK